jgi:hypothetical protein
LVCYLDDSGFQAACQLGVEFERALHPAHSFGLLVGCWRISSIERCIDSGGGQDSFFATGNASPGLSNQCATNVPQILQSREFFEAFAATSEPFRARLFLWLRD